MKLELYRHKNTIKKGQTLGTMCVVTNDNITVLFSCKTLELEWNENRKGISCIPSGSYKVTKEKHTKFGACFRVHEVSGRSGILIHVGNYKKQIKGCILVGERFVDLDGDKFTDVTNSRQTINRLYDILPLEFKLTIYN